MVKIEASVVIKAPRKQVYEWFSKPENLTKYEKTVWKSTKIHKREGNVVTAVQEGVISGKSAKGTFKYTCFPPEKIESVWSEGSYGNVKIREQPFGWVFAEATEGTKVSWLIEAKGIACIQKVLGSRGKTELNGIMLEELKKMKATIEKG